MLAPVVEEQRFSAALALVVAGARPDRIDPTPVFFGLRMHLGVAIDLGRGRLQDLGPDAFGQAEHVDGAVHRGLRRLHRIELVVNRTRRAGHVVDFVDLHVEREGHVVAHELEIAIVDQVTNVHPRPGEEIVEADHLVALLEQALT
jgi:hypothetical protein